MKMNAGSEQKIKRAAVKSFSRLLIGAITIAVAILAILDITAGFVGSAELMFAANAHGGTGAVEKLATVVETGFVPTKLLLIFPMLLPVFFVVLFVVSVLRARRTRFNLAFVIPVAILVTFCCVMAIVNMFMSMTLQCCVFMVLGVFACGTLMVYNMIDNRQNLNLRGTVRKAGLVGICVCLMALSFSNPAQPSNDRLDDGLHDDITISNQIDK